MTGDQEPEPRPRVRRSFLGQRSIGGPDPRPVDRPAPPIGPEHDPDPDELLWIDTGSGPGLEVPARMVRRFIVPPFPTRTLSGPAGPDRPEPSPVPHTIPDDIQADALRAMIRRHRPHRDSGRCACGALLGQETGLCRGAALALERLMRLADDAEATELAEEVEKYLPPADD